MLHFNSALLSLAAGFTGSYAPWTAVHIQPHAGGVLVTASDEGRVAMLGFDSKGEADETLDLIPDSDLVRACNGIKSAERDVLIDGSTATVTTYRKEPPHAVRQFTVRRTDHLPPSLDRPIAGLLERWGSTPTTSGTAGRYALPYLERAIKATGHLADSVVLSSFDGGPLRLQCESLDIVVLVLPMVAEPIPPLPGWLQSYGNRIPSTA